MGEMFAREGLQCLTWRFKKTEPVLSIQNKTGAETFGGDVCPRGNARNDVEKLKSLQQNLSFLSKTRHRQKSLGDMLFLDRS